MTERASQHENTTTHFADMIPEDRLVLCASDLPLEPRLGLPIVGNLQCSCTIANLWQVRHGIPDSDSSVDSTIASVDKHFSDNEALMSCEKDLQPKNII